MNPAMPSMRGFDSELQMFREPPRELNSSTLNFLRWLVEHGRLADDLVAEPPEPVPLSSRLAGAGPELVPGPWGLTFGAPAPRNVQSDAA